MSYFSSQNSPAPQEKKKLYFEKNVVIKKCFKKKLKNTNPKYLLDSIFEIGKDHASGREVMSASSGLALISLMKTSVPGARVKTFPSA